MVAVPAGSLHSFLLGSWVLTRSLHYSRGGAAGGPCSFHGIVCLPRTLVLFWDRWLLRHPRPYLASVSPVTSQRPAEAQRLANSDGRLSRPPSSALSISRSRRRRPASEPTARRCCTPKKVIFAYVSFSLPNTTT